MQLLTPDSIIASLIVPVPQSGSSRHSDARDVIHQTFEQGEVACGLFKVVLQPCEQ